MELARYRALKHFKKSLFSVMLSVEMELARYRALKLTEITVRRYIKAAKAT